MSISLGDVASLIAALAFVGLVAFLARPLVSLARAFDEARDEAPQSVMAPATRSQPMLQAPLSRAA